MVDNESNTCAICHDNMSNEENTPQNHTLSCEHCFHTTCILNWFRRGAQTCPSCRDPGAIDEKMSLGFLTLRARAAYLRRKVRGTNGGPPGLRKLVCNIRKIEDKIKLNAGIYQKFRSDNKLVFAETCKHRRNKWALHRKKRDIERLIGLYEDSTLKLPNLLISSQNPDDYSFGRRRQ